jgi:hypothetical protein
MKRGTCMLKKEQDKLFKLVKTYLYTRNAEADPTAFYQYKIKTKAGILLVSFGKNQGAIFCRFDDPDAALKIMTDYTSRVRLNTISGKWNFHFGRTPADDAFQVFKGELDRVL